MFFPAESQFPKYRNVTLLLKNGICEVLYSVCRGNHLATKLSEWKWLYIGIQKGCFCLLVLRSQTFHLNASQLVTLNKLLWTGKESSWQTGCPGNAACMLTFHSTYITLPLDMYITLQETHAGERGGGDVCGRQGPGVTFLRMRLVTAHHRDSRAASTIGN